MSALPVRRMGAPGSKRGRWEDVWSFMASDGMQALLLRQLFDAGASRWE